MQQHYATKKNLQKLSKAVFRMLAVTSQSPHIYFYVYNLIVASAPAENTHGWLG